MVCWRAESVFVSRTFASKSFAAAREAFSNAYPDNEVLTKTAIHRPVTKLLDTASVCDRKHVRQCWQVRRNNERKLFVLLYWFHRSLQILLQSGCVLNGTFCTCMSRWLWQSPTLYSYAREREYRFLNVVFAALFLLCSVWLHFVTLCVCVCVCEFFAARGVKGDISQRSYS
jgi:hypothetical protein